MQIVECEYGPVCVGVISGELSRFARFHISLNALMVPPDSTWAWEQGSGYASQRNIVAQQALDCGAKWLWFIDDDHTFAPDVLMRLLAHDVPIVQPLVSTRKPPYLPYAYRFDGERYVSVGWDGLEDGLMKVDASACGGMLIRRDVLETVDFPWFVEGKCGMGPGEDFYFSEQAKRFGFQGYVDCETRMGHISLHDVWPNRYNSGDWCVDLKLDHGLVARLPSDFGHEALMGCSTRSPATSE